MNKKLKDIKKDLMNDEIRELYDSSKILDTINNTGVDISLSHFETYLLPYIIREIEINEKTTAVFYYNIRKIAKSFKSPIYVIDDNGEVKYKLPPLIIDVNDDSNNISYNRIVKKYLSTIDSNASLANRVFNKEIDEVEKVIANNKEEEDKYVKEFIKIYNDYKHRLKNNLKNSNLIKDEEDIEDDFLDY